MSASKWVYLWLYLRVLVYVRVLARPFGHPTQVSTQVQLAATCNYLRVRLAKALRYNSGERTDKQLACLFRDSLNDCFDWFVRSFIYSFIFHLHLFRLQFNINNRKRTKKREKEQSKNMKLHFLGEIVWWPKVQNFWVGHYHSAVTWTGNKFLKIRLNHSWKKKKR